MKKIYLVLILTGLAIGLFSISFSSPYRYDQFPGLNYFTGPFWTTGTSTSFEIDYDFLNGIPDNCQRFEVTTDSNWLTIDGVSFNFWGVTFDFDINGSNNTGSVRTSYYSIVLYETDEFNVEYVVGSITDNISQFPADMVSPLQTLISNASSGDTITLPSGTYTGYCGITNKDLTIIGEGPGLTILRGNAYKSVVGVQNAEVHLINLSIENGTAPTGAAVFGVGNADITLENVHIHDCFSRPLYTGGVIPDNTSCSIVSNCRTGCTTTFEKVVTYDNRIQTYVGTPCQFLTNGINIENSTLLHDSAWRPIICGVNTCENSIIEYPPSTGTYTNSVYLSGDESVTYPAGLTQITDPYFTDPDNGDYTLNWDNDGKSDCIGNVFATDGTTVDVGAYQFDDKRLNYQFDTDDPKTENWFWVGFPVIDPIGNHDQLDGFFAEFMDDDDPFTVHQFSYQTPDYDNEAMIVTTSENEGGYWDDESEIIKQYKGYKVQIDNGAAINNYHGVCIRNDEPVSIPFGEVETWVCYYGSESSTSPVSAFGGTLGNQLKRIHGQYWSYEKHVEIIGDSLFSQMIITWEGVANQSYYDGVQYGDMIVVETENPASFIWDEGFVSTGGGNVVTTVFNNIEADTDLNYFDYTEQADYNTFVFEFAPDDIPQEIAVYANGECIGASVVHGQDAAVFAYVTDDLYDANIDIVKWYGEREEVFSENLQVYDAEQKKYMEKDIRLSPEHQRVRISYVEHDYKEEEAPEAYSFTGKNYPNPFNPTTTISYSLPEESNVCIEIYNIKGQKVKQLVNEHKESGHHAIKWNGTDENNKSVGSGVYFYKVKTEKSSLINKMIMLK